MWFKSFRKYLKTFHFVAALKEKQVDQTKVRKEKVPQTKEKLL